MSTPVFHYTPPRYPSAPVEGIWAKRDDLYHVQPLRPGLPQPDAWGGKARVIEQICRAAIKRGKVGVITSGGRFNAHCNAAAHIAKAYSLDCHLFIPPGRTTAEMKDAARMGARLYRRSPGHPWNLQAAARAFARGRASCVEIPYGLETPLMPEATAPEVRNLPPPGAFHRLVVAVGTGMSLVGVLWGIERYRPDLIKTPILGVVVGTGSSATVRHRFKLLAWWVKNLRKFDLSLLVASGYHGVPIRARLPDGSVLDPYYEAKAWPYVKPGDLLWVVACARTARDRTGEGK